MGDKLKLGKYRHFKGNKYEVIGVARHSETLEDVVVYRALYGNHDLLVRPLKMFTEEVEVDGKEIPRFSAVEQEESRGNVGGSRMEQRIASKAFVIHDGKVLIVREAPAYKGGTNVGKYVSPGGKLEPGENFQEALEREIKEECGLTIRVGDPFFVAEWRPVVNGTQLQIIAVFFEWFADTDHVVLDRNHDDYRWIDPAEHSSYDMNQPLRDAFKRYLTGRGLEELYGRVDN